MWVCSLLLYFCTFNLFSLFSAVFLILGLNLSLMFEWQAHYHWSHCQSFWHYFSQSVLCFSPELTLNHNPPISISHIVGIRGMSYPTWPKYFNFLLVSPNHQSTAAARSALCSLCSLCWAGLTLWFNLSVGVIELGSSALNLLPPGSSSPVIHMNCSSLSHAVTLTILCVYTCF
jgi:hypothetical protein